MAAKNSHLHSALWPNCDELRGGMDACQDKECVLTPLFVTYVSDKYAGKASSLIEVPEGGGFADMVKLKGDEQLGDTVTKLIDRRSEPNDLTGVTGQAGFTDEDELGHGQEMQDCLSKLAAIFDGLDSAPSGCWRRPNWGTPTSS